MATNLLARRQLVLDVAFRDHPERFVRHPPHRQICPLAVWINKPPKEEKTP
jgi:hypothetical protein